jgi:hypothetical protein
MRSYFVSIDHRSGNLTRLQDFGEGLDLHGIDVPWGHEKIEHPLDVGESTLARQLVIDLTMVTLLPLRSLFAESLNANQL